MDLAIEEFKNRNLLILLDKSNGQNKTQLVSSGKKLDYDTLNEFISLSYGMLKVCLKSNQIEKLLLKPMNTSSLDYVSVDAREGITTGISTEDRLKAIKHLVEDNADPRSLVSPGHIVPCLVNTGGVVAKNAIPEAAYDICNYSFESNGALIAELLNENGEPFSEKDLKKFSKDNKISIFKLEDITRFFLQKRKIVSCQGKAKLPSYKGGDLIAYIYTVDGSNKEHIALVKGNISKDKVVSVRVHVENSFEDIFGNSEISSKSNINLALNHLNNVESGIFLYLKPGFNVENKKNSPHENMRNYGIGAQIIRDLGAKKINVIAKNKTSLLGLEAFGLEIIDNTSFDEIKGVN